MQTENRFVKGIVADYDPTDVDNTTLVFPTMGVRLFNKKGQGFIATNLESNELAFSLSDGFIAIGAREFNGILYIVSVKYIDSNTSYREIGTYPSPSQVSFTTNLMSEATIDTNITGFEQTYKPLGNLYASAARRRFTTIFDNYLNWTYNNLVDLKIKESYDGSVDLYISDYVNPNKVINSGFDEDGVYTDRMYTYAQLKGYTDLIPSTDQPMSVVLSSVENGGNLQPGNYWLFFKYVTKSFASTKFCSEIGPIPIGVGTMSLEVQGVQEKDWLHNIENKANKKIVLNISDIDSAYDYIQVGVLRYSAFIENGAATTDTFLIDKYYKIDGTTLEIEVTGYDTESILTLEEITEGVIPYNIVKGQNVLNGRYLGVSWKKQHSYTDDIRTHLYNFAQAITISYQNTGQLENGGTESNSSSLPQYKDPIDTEQHLGYFKGEVYPFGVKYVFTNGYISEAFPCKSADGMALIAGLTADQYTKGLYRFPDWNSNIFTGGNVNFAAVLSVQFDITDAVTYKTANSDAFADIIGYYFVRGPRLENMIGQGIMINVANCATGTSWDGTYYRKYFDGGIGSNSVDAKIIPAFEYPDGSGIKIPTAKNENDTAWKYESFYTTLAADLIDDKFALFCPDYIFTENLVNEGDSYFLKFVRSSYNEVELVGGWSPTIIKSREPSWGSTVKAENWYPCTISNIGLAVTSSGSNFVSLLKDGRTYSNTTEKGFYVSVEGNSNYVYNRSIVSQKYLGIIMDSPWTDVSEQRNIVSIYKAENDVSYFNDALDNFDISTIKYSKISSFIPIGSTAQTFNCFKGDCFWQNTFIRALRWFGQDNNSSDIGSDGIYYYHGLVLGFWSENKVNTAMRNELRFRNASNSEGLYTYYPKLLSTGNLSGWLSGKGDASLIEATQINDGYNKAMSPVQAIGYDSTIDLSDTNKKNRIYFSDKQITSSQVDAFRNIGVNNYQDFLLDNSDFTALEIYKGRVLGVLKNSLIEIYVDERVIQSQQAGDDLIAASRNYISDRFRVIENYGSQQKFAVLETPNGIYGYDWLRRIFWRVSLHITDTGSSMLVSEDLSRTKFIQTYFEDIFSSIITSTDITVEVGDNPVLFNGIHLGYDRQNKDVLMTILDNSNQIEKTIVFNEDINAFIGEYPFVPTMYANINNDFFSIEPDRQAATSTGNFYKHNILNSYQKFYGDQEDFQLSFIVNANKSKEGLGELVKIFESMNIEMGEIDLNRINYITEYQTGYYDFNTTSIVDSSEYEDNGWRVPITVSIGAGTGQYEEDSELTGRYLKVTITYNPTGDAEDIQIKKVITNFSIR